jgi:MFS family permease
MVEEEKNRTLRELFPPLNLLPLLLSYTIDHIAVSSYWIFFGIFLSEEISSSYLDVAVILAVPAIISVFGTTALSSFSDKTGRRKLLIFGSKIALMLQYVLLLVMSIIGPKVWNILLILVCFGIFAQIYYSQVSALITIICPPDRKGQVSSYQIFFASLGWMIGSSLSDIIYDWKGIIGSLGFAAGFALLAGFIAMFSTSKPYIEQKKDISIDVDYEEEIETWVLNGKPRVVEPIKSSEKYASYFDIFKRRKILVLLVTLAILDFGFGPFNVITSVYFKNIYVTHFSNEALANTLIAKSNTIATVLGMVILLISGAILDRTGRKPILIFSILCYPILYTLMFFLSSHPWALFAIYLYPLYALKVPTANTIMADLTSENERGRGMSLIQIEQILFGNLGAILGCYIADIFPGDIIPRFVPEGIYIIPIFPMILGFIALILSIFLVKESNPKILAKIAGIENMSLGSK